ncbi:MAG: antitoxin Xre/MbcA/ParS toxin-binding domain-containing protein [Ginsengibacter sp.]
MPLKNNTKKDYAVSSSKKSIISEPGLAYEKSTYPMRANLSSIKKGNNSKVDVILTGSALKPENQLTSMEKMSIVQSGLSKRDLENLKAKTKLDYGKLATALSVTRATLINKKKQEKFNPVLSERIMSLADIYSYGYEVFEDEDRFNQWMLRPNQALNGRLPYDVIDNQFGREEVKDIIGRIAYGVYS